MEMKDIILSTLQEFEENEPIELDNKKEEINNYKGPSEQKLPPVKKATGIEELQSIMNSVQNISDSQYKEEQKVIEAPAPIQQEYQEQVDNMEIYQNAQIQQKEQPTVVEPTISNVIETRNTNTLQNQIENETKFLTSLRERILVIFEGLQSPNNRSLDAKVDLIINFLEYQLAMFDERLENLRKEL
jgi:hypothetical protein